MQTKVLITIDTEVRIRHRELPGAFEVDVLGEVGGQKVGTDWIAEMLSQHGFKGVFFLDVYGSHLFGRARYQQISDRLISAGHTVELHTHPDQAYDLKRLHMHEYSLAEQIGALEDGISLLKEWTGRAPVAHRAGRYGANADTLTALKTVGVRLDSSFFYKRADCKLTFSKNNLPVLSDGVWEIPVTAVAEPLTKAGVRLPFWTRRLFCRYQKLDVNCMSPAQLCGAVTSLIGRLPYVVLFLHSFSFARPEKNGFSVDQDAIATFKAILQLLVDKRIEVTTFPHVAEDLILESQKCVQSVKA